MAYSGLGGGKLSAVDAILAEAADLVALEQIAKLNTAHLADDSALPSTLESRFRKLKSLPVPAAPVKTLGRSVTATHAAAPLDPPQPNPAPQYQQPPAPTPTVQQQQQPGPGEDAAGKKENSPPQQQANHEDDDEEDLERLFGGSGGGRGRPMLRERNSRPGSTSPPRPRQACCFAFSPKKGGTPTKSKKKVHGSAACSDEWGDENRRMATELKEQQRELKKALEDQVKVSRETAKMARWVKQASARMAHTAAIDDLLSDREDDDEFK